MKIVFFGTPSFAAQILRYLLDHSAEIVAVVTRPDRPRGRSQKISPSAVKQVWLDRALSIPLYQPEKASTETFVNEMLPLSPDLFVVVAYGEIIKTTLLKLPKYGCINVHASLLPKLRGAAPIQRAILSGQKETGVTIMEMVLQMDAGDILAAEKVTITPEMTAGELEQTLCDLACPLLLRTLEQIMRGCVEKKLQDPSEVTFAPKIHSEDRLIDWHHPAQKIHDQIRGLSPHPGAYCYVYLGEEKKQLTVRKARVKENVSGAPGEMVEWTHQSGCVGCGTGVLELLEVQLEGKSKTSIKDFISGLQSRSIKFV